MKSLPTRPRATVSFPCPPVEGAAFASSFFYFLFNLSRAIRLGYSGGKLSSKSPLGPPSSRPVQVTDTGRPHEQYVVPGYHLVKGVTPAFGQQTGGATGGDGQIQSKDAKAGGLFLAPPVQQSVPVAAATAAKSGTETVWSSDLGRPRARKN